MDDGEDSGKRTGQLPACDMPLDPCPKKLSHKCDYEILLHAHSVFLSSAINRVDIAETMLDLRSGHPW